MEKGLKWIGGARENKNCDELDKPKQRPVVMIPASQLAKVLVGIPHMQLVIDYTPTALPSTSLWSSPQTIDSILHEMWWLFTYPLQENSDAMKCRVQLVTPWLHRTDKPVKRQTEQCMGNFDVWVWPKWPGNGVIPALLYNGWLCTYWMFCNF